jgi:putative ABC transport system ATP-binding protein
MIAADADVPLMLELHGVRKVFNPKTPHEIIALGGIDLKVEKGSFVIVIGTNGSGKSALLNAIAGSIPLESGRICLMGRDITEWPEYIRSKHIGRVFQNPLMGTMPELTIAENLALCSSRSTLRSLRWAMTRRLMSEIKDRVASLDLGLETRLNDKIEALSGGQRQALTLLMAAWTSPALLLLDEHTAALDPKSAELVLQLSEQIISRERITAIMVTHSMQQAVNLGDRLLMMHKGQIAYDDTGPDKQRLRVRDLLSRFEMIRCGEQVDQSAAVILAEQII